MNESLISLIKSKTILDELAVSYLEAGNSVVIFNTESIYHFYHNIEYKNYVDQCTHIAIDGIGVKIILQLFGCKISRFHGPDFLNCLLNQKDHISLVTAGGSTKNNQLVQEGLLEKYIELPYTNNLDEIMMVLSQAILASPFRHPENIGLLISLGLPKQELIASKFIAHRIKEPSRVFDNITIIPIGAAIDFLTGAKKRSSKIWQLTGTEWLPRLIREPRMFPRIIKSILGIILIIKNEVAIKIST
jgi:N-acetylglucosaminyldiphosphoundecaprenol N-acetyl-beta-D-mannosaminyltransferase